MKILLIGPQGSGKSTQGKLLAAYLKIPYISTGDIFRTIASENTEKGIRIKNILDSGRLVDNQIAIELIKERLGLVDCKDGFILDGYPRTLEQAERVDLCFDKVFYINVPEHVVIERLMKRGRADDNEQSIKQRLTLYYQQTQPLLDYYNHRGMMTEIDGTKGIQIVKDEIKKSL